MECKVYAALKWASEEFIRYFKTEPVIGGNSHNCHIILRSWQEKPKQATVIY